MEILSRSESNGAAVLLSVVEILVAETVLVAQRSFLWLVLAMGSLPSEVVPCPEEPQVIYRRILGKSKSETVPENKDDGESDDDDDEDEEEDDDGEDQDDDGARMSNRVTRGTRMKEVKTTMTLRPTAKGGATTTTTKKTTMTTTMTMMRRVRTRTRRMRTTKKMRSCPSHPLRRGNDLKKGGGERMLVA
uniref:Uncharacterized protein n=1 Tax=Ananas comosus var. bracteatus TaxID=296719 RepID=A0A6V7PM17_ANACO|nr:unnamed protein product [Ananas comosus var. bracteatus]